ncbi:MAG: amino acid adenylation domain-containing protein [Alphaproteobacteria bacterium]|nr:amino acid adenylation domain-containing protein [Alphaproteobacteria bacterium]
MAESTGLSGSGSGWRVEQVFARRCQCWPDRPAVELADHVVTYAELEFLSNRLAHRLIGLGIGPGDIVALAAGDAAVFALGSLAILKSGAAYLALDTRHSASRARQVLAQRSAALLLAGDDLPDDVEPEGLRRLRDFAEPSVLRDHPANAPPPRGGPGDAAHVCYTSGSTGAPKGVVVAHAGIEGLVEDAAFIEVPPGYRFAQTSTFAFDASTLEVWATLLHGGCLVGVPREVLLSAGPMADFLAGKGIDGLWLTTSLFNAITSRRPDAFRTVDTVVIGGEAADPVSVGRVLNGGAPPRRLVNGYGPTEATTLATWHEITAEDVAAGRIPIGRPLRGRTVAVVDAEMSPVAPGVEGELVIGGPAVALGYLGDPVLTRERFLPDPASPGGRLYRTGDLCRARPDGAIEFLGRLDEQVKVRGHRVEPTGVAVVLASLPGVEEAVVLPRETSFGTRELVGFVRGARLSGPALREMAAGRLPDYMVPGAIHVFDAFPLKATGKVDRHALLEAAAAGSMPAIGGPAPETAVQRVLLEVWQTVLQRRDIGLDDEYRALGGDSMSILELVLEVESRFGLQLSVDDVAEPTTVRGLAALIEDRGSAGPSRPIGARTFVIGQPWNMLKIPDAIGDAMSGGAPWRQLQISPLLFGTGIHGRLESMAEHLEGQVLAEGPGPYVLGGHSFGGLLALETAQRLRRRGEEVALLVLIESHFAGRRPWRDEARLLLDRAGRFARRNWREKAKRMRRKLKLALHVPATPSESLSHDHRIFQRCVAARMGYVPAPYAGPAMVFRSTTSGHFDPLPRQVNLDRWAELLTGPVEEHLIEGDHMSVVLEAGPVAAVARCLTGWPSRLRPGRSAQQLADDGVEHRAALGGRPEEAAVPA